MNIFDMFIGELVYIDGGDQSGIKWLARFRGVEHGVVFLREILASEFHEEFDEYLRCAYWPADSALGLARLKEIRMATRRESECYQKFLREKTC